MRHPWSIASLLALAGACAGPASTPDARPDDGAARPDADWSAYGADVTIIVEPGDGGAALRAAIQGAHTSVHMTMYLLTSSSVVSALVAQHQAGREVQVVLNHTFPPGTSVSNQGAYDTLTQAGVDVRWASNRYTYTHEKCVLIDGATAWIMTMNATVSAPTGNREYLAVDTTAADVAEAEAVFQADRAGAAITPSGDLLVAPVDARPALLALIARAADTLDVEAEELADNQVVAGLSAAADRGVAVRIVLSDDPPSSAQASAVATLQNHGVHLVTLSSPYVHAKSIVADGAAAYVGSENFTSTSLTANRELGVIFSAPAEVAKVATTTAADFAAGTAL